MCWYWLSRGAEPVRQHRPQPEITPAPSAELTEEPLESTASAVTSEPVQTGLFAEQIFSGADGDIHYSYYLPDSYDGSRKFPMMVVMPGYNMMWFGEDSSGSNLNWSGFTAWTRLDTEMVVVSAQLTDWGEKSARQAIELTEYFINSFAVDTGRVYAAGYSAGGETMSRAVAMRPDLYAAYLHGASQWDGELCSHCGERCDGLHLHGRRRRVLRQRQGPLGLRKSPRCL